MVAALVHINEIATNSCGPSRVNHSHFWAEGSRHCSRPSKPASLVLFGETRVVRQHGCMFLHGGVHTYLPVDGVGDGVRTFAFKDAQNYCLGNLGPRERHCFWLVGDRLDGGG